MNLGGLLYLTYGEQDPANHDDVPCTGHGFVDVFDLQCNLQTRLPALGALQIFRKRLRRNIQ
jgi:hypothetical protein